MNDTDEKEKIAMTQRRRLVTQYNIIQDGVNPHHKAAQDAYIKEFECRAEATEARQRGQTWFVKILTENRLQSIVLECFSPPVQPDWNKKKIHMVVRKVTMENQWLADKYRPGTEITLHDAIMSNGVSFYANMTVTRRLMGR